MSCYHPLKGFVIGEDSIDGERHRKIKIVPYKIDGLEVNHLEKVSSEWHPVTGDSTSSFASKSSFLWYTIPCGQCIGCRLDYSRQWANRLMMELEDHDPSDCWFLTLTYDPKFETPDHILSSNTETGEATLTLNKRDVQLFHKRLRKEFPRKNLRFWLSGEYGESTARPHYHGIYFSLCLDGFDPSDRRNVWCRTDQGFTLYHWPKLDEVWGLGRVIIAPVTWDTCAYTARYVCKKLTGPLADFYEVQGIIPEFSLMSRKPGIARHYFESLEDFDPTKKLSLSTNTKGLTFSPPRYFKDLWKVDNQLESDIIGVRNLQLAKQRKELIQSKNDLAREDWLAYLQSCENNHLSGSKKLLRDAL